MVQEYYFIKVETHDEFDDEFSNDNGDKVNPAECIQDMWNDYGPGDCYNFRIESIEEFVEFEE